MYKLTLLLIPLILLSSCTIDWNDEKERKITELEKQIQDDTFKKKQECEKYKPSAVEKYKNDTNYYLSNIFYSKKYDSCLYGISNKTSGPYSHIIIDYLSGKEIIWKNDQCNIDDKSCTERQKLFNDTVE